MLVGGAGDIRLTKDGCELLNDMHIQHPTAALIARTATAQDDITGDGTSSIVLLIGEMLAQASRYLAENTHPSILIEGMFLAKIEAQRFLKEYKEKMQKKIPIDREVLVSVAKTSLRTKVAEDLADQLADIVVDAVTTIQDENKIDLHMVEIMHMVHKMDKASRFVNGLVLDHGARHPDMSRNLNNCFILTCNISLEYEKSEVNSKFVYKNAQQQKALVDAERKVVDKKVQAIIDLKNEVCKNGEGFVVINQKGIDPISLDMFAKAGISALRRAKRRNMERLTLACGGNAINSIEELNIEALGHADHVYEQMLGEDRFTFVEGVKGKSCTILLKGPNLHTIAQIKGAVRDGLRAVKNAIDDKCVIPGAGAFELELYKHLSNFAETISGRPKLGVKVFAEAMLVIPKTLADNSGLDPEDCILEMEDALKKDLTPGLNISNGKVLDPIQEGILDNYKVKQQILEAATYSATQLLYVDAILSANRKSQQQ